MRNRAEWIAGGLGSAVLLAVIGVFAVTHYQAVVHPGAQQASVAQQTGPAGLSFPTVEQMCKAAGAGAADMADCVNEETSAAEFVGAWLELNGFVANGRIDLEQIQLSAELDAADDPGLVGGPLSADPLDADPLSAATPADSGPVAPDADNVLPGTPTSSSSSPAQIALLCLQDAADDWLKMHDCIAHNDPSSTLGGN
ncbi:MAG TPA: hypothetical protein VFW28_15845 [Micropepsaceae bacterium]|nr:hypothetical protein [Micropepsaceae bacterium]